MSTPRSVYTEANSAPITPPPITAMRSGSLSAESLVDWSEVVTLTPSTSMPGMARGTEPAQMMTALPRSVCAVHRDRAVGGQRAEALDDGDLAPLEQAAEAAVQLADDARLALVRRGPVGLRACRSP